MGTFDIRLWSGTNYDSDAVPFLGVALVVLFGGLLANGSYLSLLSGLHNPGSRLNERYATDNSHLASDIDPKFSDTSFKQFVLHTFFLSPNSQSLDQGLDEMMMDAVFVMNVFVFLL